MTTSLDSPTVSVIIPSFNCAPYISQAISSALSSRGVSLEVLVIDDESTDGTWRILEGFGDSIRRFRQSKGGPYKARNLGSRLAQGQWLAFLDADDDWLPDKLAKQLAVADDETQLVYTDRFNFGDTHRVKKRQSEIGVLFEGEVFEALLLGNFITLSSVMIRKGSFEQLGGFSESHPGVQDWDLWLRCASLGYEVKVVREPLTRYRIHEHQMSGELDLRAAERVAVVQRALQTPRGQKVARRVSQQAMAGVWKVGAWDAARTRRWKAIGWYLRSAFYWPRDIQVYKEIVKCLLDRA
ncbi:MAG: glycosyltransferase [Thermoanaerobaculia bacterium]